MKKNTKKKNRILSKRIVSIATALAVLSGSIPVFEIYDASLNLTKPLRAWAYNSETSNEVKIGSFQKLVDYSNEYDYTHANDTLIINFGDSETSGELSGFTSIGTESAPFDGKIKIAAGMTLNLPTTMFGWITDDVQIVDTDGNNTELVLTRTQLKQDEPLFAENVIHNSSSAGAEWSIHYNSYYNPLTSSTYVNNFSGFIGTLDEGAKVKFTSLTFDNSGGNGTANISATGDVGLVCRTMDAESTLEIDEITQTNGSNDFKIESTSSGNVGGLVGTMNDGAKLILGEDLENVQGSNKEIKAASGYAGGIVGYCSGGTIKFNNSSAYIVSQVINGTNGSGGIVGYYNTVSANASTNDRYTISTEKVSIGSSCKVNGDGNCGGLFGEVNNDGDMTISGSEAVSPAHGSGAADSFGGLIGKYTAEALTDSLTVSTTGSNAPERSSGGSVSQFGGLIGEVSGASYVKFDGTESDGINVSTTGASATTNFGGLVGKASNAFIELSGKNTIGYSGVSTTKTFGGVVGDFQNGVIYLQGTTDLSGSPSVTDAASSSGQVAGYRDNGLIFAASGWSMKRSANSQKLDDVGSWGEIVRFDTVPQDSVLTINDVTGDDKEHYVTLLPAVSSMSNTTDFVKTALNIQLNDGQTSGVLRCSGSNSETLLGASSSLEFSGSSTSIELNGTGITGLTRDNGANKVEFEGAFNGNGGKIKLATGESYCAENKTEGDGRIYRHAYNGLFAKTNGATIQNLNIASDSSITVKALDNMYVGNVVALASGNLTLDTVKVCNDGKNIPEDYATIDNAGSSINIGGLIGNLTSAGTVSITGCEYQGEIKGSATSSKIGGLIGSVSDSNTFGITISDTTKVGGKITAASGNEVGGTIAVIDTSTSGSSGRTLTLSGLTVSGLDMNVSGTCGGFLGQNWYKTDVEFTNFKVGSGASLTSAGDTAGLVHTATGYWKVNGNGITLGSDTSGDTVTVTASSADNFGLLVTNGYASDSAIYLELAPSAYTVNKSKTTLTMGSVSVFDELVAYTGSGSDVLGNGKGVVSIATADHALLTMGDSNTGSTYQHQTAFLDTNTSLRNNPHSRYYYNLDTYRSNPSAGAQQLLIWSVRQYAHKSIQGYFNFTGSSISGTMNMAGYSYYPIDLTGSIALNGAVSLYNTEFDATETSTTDNRLTTESAQHYLMQNGLFRNVSGTLTFNGSLDGNINKIDNYCGALVMDTVSSDAIGSPAKINVNGLVLAGITISNAGPLLINKAGSNSTLNITNVSNDDSSYTTKGAGATTPSYIATSLLGNIGSADSTAVKLTFSKIKLDGRNATGVTNLPDLTSVYHSKGSLFSKSTLVDTFAYKDNSGSFGVYNFEYSDDWGGTRTVTYGSEIDSTVENRDNITNKSKQLYYNNSSQFTRPDSSGNVGSEYGQFARDFQKYVYAGYVQAESKHELRVNVQGVKTKGCGTYNDPYIIVSESDLITYSRIINESNTDSQTISVPTAVANGTSENATWCTDKTDHRTYTVYDSTTKYWYVDNTKSEATKLSNDTLRKYLAGAYYKIDPEITNDITLSATSNPKFDGFSSGVGGKYAFRGVIDGSGKTIINQTTNPLIANSHGSVVYNLKLDVQPTTAMKLSMTNNKTFSETGAFNSDRCEFYGAVIGQVFGGDNIIDNVSVKFTGSVINANSKSKAYLVPIGGYVGVVMNGGLIFREMTGLEKDDQAGISAANLTGFGDGVGDTPTDPTASDNTKWLYVNPIVGRVLNGYVITESSSYKPFEDGTRKYPDDSTDTWSAGAVTMRNGTKNYSITDISTSDTSSFAMEGVADGSDITISSAQAMFIMSLITQSGLGKSTTGQYGQRSNLKPYDENMATHLAEYNHIGTATATSDTDYSKAQNDVQCTATLTDKIPYLVKTYTPLVSGSYPAFAVMGSASASYDLILSGSDTTFYLPDSYRGLGSLMFGVSPGGNLDNYTDNVIYLNRLNGNNNSVSLNMNLKVYKEDNYLTLKGDQSSFKTGFALINCLQSSGTFEALTIRGNVGYKKYGTDGSVIAYTTDNIGKNDNPDPAVSSFVGVPVAGSSNMTFSNIEVDGMDISGMCYVGGFVGVVNISATLTFTGCSADNLKIFAGCAAGGLIGYLRNNGAKVVADFETTGEGGKKEQGSFGIISIISTLASTSIANDGAPGAGGLIGYRKTGVQENQILSDDNFTISNVKIKNGTRVTKGYIGYDKDAATPNTNYIPAGGIIGNGAAATVLNANNVVIENLDIWGAYAGGFAGKLTHSKSKFTITNSEVKSTQNVSIKSVYNNSASASGGFIGYNDCGQDSIITDSKLTGYTISGTYNVGGLIGHNSTSATKTLNNIKVSGHTLSGTNNVGGLVGYQQDGALNGYNILVKKQTSAATTEGGSITNNGYIVGNNDSKVIRIVGFSRQGTIDTAAMVGNKTATVDDRYGTGGYVIFADYNDTASDPNPNVKFSNMQSEGVNIGEGSATRATVSVNTYTIVKDASGNVVSCSPTYDPDPTTNRPDVEPIEGLTKENPIQVTGEGKKLEYVASESSVSLVTSVDDLTGTGTENGFYLQTGTERTGNKINGKNPQNMYLKNTTKGNGYLELNGYPNDLTNAGVWHFEKDGTKYKVYTYTTGHEGEAAYKKYLSRNNGFVSLNSSGTSFDLAYQTRSRNDGSLPTKTGLEITDGTYYFEYSNINTGFQFGNNPNWTDGHDVNYANAILFVYAIPPNNSLKSSTYSNGITFDGSNVDTTGLPSVSYDNADDITTYNNAITGLPEENGPYVVYSITQTVKKNIYEDADVHSPYVTTNPRYDTVTMANTQWLVSDGVSNTSYYGSAAQSIVQGINSNKGYKNTDLTAAQTNTLRTQLISNMSSIQSVVSATTAGAYSGEDIPVLVLDDMTTANELVNTYLRTLTNTNYNFACGYSDGSTYSGNDRLIYNLDISKWKYSTVTGKFEKLYQEPSLKCRVNDVQNGFYITATDVDNENWQFSLIDVQFYDPSNRPEFNASNECTKAGLIAYHLYVPVVVKKMLYYSVQIRPASTTSYNLDAYPTSRANVVENLGNPITMKVTYTYWQTADYWEDAINSGEKVCRNYNKILDVKAWEDHIQPGSIAVLVDPNNNADKYYESTLASVLTEGEVIDTGTKTYKLNLNSFAGFSVTNLNDLMTITVDNDAETKNLVECSANDPDLVCIARNGNADLPLRYKTTADAANSNTVYYAVNVALKGHQNDGEYVQEHYYISIFTKENPADNDMYHYQVSSTGTNFGDSSYPSARVGTKETPHIFLGNIYTNNITISETNSNQLMSSNNLSLSANLTATVGFTPNAISKEITTSIDNDNVKIYQTFMVSLNRLNGGTNQRGILVDPSVVTPTNYKINGATTTDSYHLNYKSSASYIELTNECDIKGKLQSAANHTITITESVSLTYLSSTLSTQFPQATSTTAIDSQHSSIGTYMIGYSNISSTSNGGAASRASKNTDGTTRLCYYIADDTSVDFSYNAVHNSRFDNDGNGNYGQLGLDGVELDGNGETYVQINSAARYDTGGYNLKTSGNYVKITVKLTKKGESSGTDPYTTALKISDYLADFEILDKDNQIIVATEDDAATDVDESIIVNTNSADNIYTYIVPKNMLKTLSDDEYYIPINFKAYSGNNESFEGKNTAKDMQYSNYKVLVTVGLLADKNDSSPLRNSDAYDHIIYTNARIHSEVID